MGSVPHVELLERQSATASLQAAPADAARGPGRVVSVSGEAGIGKTSLVRPFLADVPRGTRVPSGSCDDPLAFVARRIEDVRAAVVLTSYAGLARVQLGDRSGLDLRRRLRELGVQRIPRGPTPAARENPAGLTARQLDVLALLAEGLSNPEIAERLVRSVRTVDHHVSAILTKLGVSSRRQAPRHAP